MNWLIDSIKNLKIFNNNKPENDNIKQNYEQNKLDVSAQIRELENKAETSNIIAKNFNILKQSIMGTIPTNELIENPEEKYSLQFNLQKTRLQEINAKNDKLTVDIEDKYSPFNNNNLDMSYGVDKDLKHNNMVPFNSYRDKIPDNYNCDNNQVVIDRYAGSSRYYFQKKEVEPFFQPIDKIKIPYNQNLLGDLERTRYMTSQSKQGERIFQPEKVNKGLNLSFNEHGTQGNFDMYRPKQYSIDEMRVENKQQKTYTLEPNTGSHFNERPIFPTPFKYKPDNSKALDPNNNIRTSSQAQGQKSITPFIMKDVCRDQYKEIIGSAMFSNMGSMNVNTYGIPQESTKKILQIEDQGHMKNFQNNFNPNEQSYQIADNERTITKQELNNFMGTLYTSYSNLTDNAKNTVKELLTNKELNTMMTSKQQSIYSNLQDDVKKTLKQCLTLQELNNFMTSFQKEVYKPLSDEAKNTIRETLSIQQTNSMMGNKQQSTYSQLTDEAKNTIKELISMKEFNSSLGSYQQANVSNLMDEQKMTMKQTTIEGFQTFIGPQKQAVITNQEDLPKITTRQLSSQQIFNTMIGPHKKANQSEFIDKPNVTTREQLSEKQFNNNIGSQQQAIYTDLQDDVKITNKQLLSNTQFNSQLGTQQKSMQSQQLDDAKITIKQLLTNEEFNTNIQGYLNTNNVMLLDKAKNTIRETLSDKEINSFVKSYQQATISNSLDDAKNTLRQLLTSNEFNSQMSSQQQSVNVHLSDEAKKTLKQLLTSKELNTQLNSYQQANITNQLDDTKNTLRQLLTTSEFNSQLGSLQQSSRVHLSDDAKITLNQLLSEIEFNSNIGSHQQANISNQLDEAKHTLKQLLSNKQLNSFVRGYLSSNKIELLDEAKHTIRQLLTTQEFNSQMGSYQKQSIVNLTDEAKNTVKQLLTSKEFNIILGSHTKESYSNLSDQAKHTIKQLLTNKEFNLNVQTYLTLPTCQLSDQAKKTIKQMLLNENYLNNIGKYNSDSYLNTYKTPDMTIREKQNYEEMGSAYINKENTTRNAELNMLQNINKEKIAIGREPTKSNYDKIPDKIAYNTELVNKISYERIEHGKLHGNEQPERFEWYNARQSNYPCNNDHIEIESIRALDNNPLQRKLLDKPIDMNNEKINSFIKNRVGEKNNNSYK